MTMKSLAALLDEAVDPTVVAEAGVQLTPDGVAAAMKKAGVDSTVAGTDVKFKFSDGDQKLVPVKVWVRKDAVSVDAGKLKFSLKRVKDDADVVRQMLAKFADAGWASLGEADDPSSRIRAALDEGSTPSWIKKYEKKAMAALKKHGWQSPAELASNCGAEDDSKFDQDDWVDWLWGLEEKGKIQTDGDAFNVAESDDLSSRIRVALSEGQHPRTESFAELVSEIEGENGTMEDSYREFWDESDKVLKAALDKATKTKRGDASMDQLASALPALKKLEARMRKGMLESDEIEEPEGDADKPKPKKAEGVAWLKLAKALKESSAVDLVMERDTLLQVRVGDNDVYVMNHDVVKYLGEDAAVAVVQAIAEADDTSTFKCPECGTKVLSNTGFCVKCKKKVKAESLEESLKPGVAKKLAGKIADIVVDAFVKEIKGYDKRNQGDAAKTVMVGRFTPIIDSIATQSMQESGSLEEAGSFDRFKKEVGTASAKLQAAGKAYDAAATRFLGVVGDRQLQAKYEEWGWEQSDEFVDRCKQYSEESEHLSEAVDAEQTIKALRDTDYKDADAFFKMVQLLNGVAAAAKGGDEKAKKFLSQLSDDLTGTAKKVLGEADAIDTAKPGDDPDPDDMDESRKLVVDKAIDEAMAAEEHATVIQEWCDAPCRESSPRDAKEQLRDVVRSIVWQVERMALEGLEDDGKRLDYEAMNEAKEGVYDLVAATVLKQVNVNALVKLAEDARKKVAKYMK
jgi:predicted RNA-binding Zn-ribbon protein involved in translation (DUF1610 family)